MKFRALSLLFPMEAILKEEKEFVDDCGWSHHNSHNPKVSPDLQDRHGSWQLTKNGFPVTGRILSEQFHVGTQSPALPIYLALWTAFAILSGVLQTLGVGYVGPILTFAYFIGFIGFFGFFPAILMGVAVVAPSLALNYIAPTLSAVGINIETVALAVAFIPAVLPGLYLFFKIKREAGILAHEGNENNGAVIAAPRSHPNEARFDQDRNSIKDKSHLIVFGNSSGKLSKSGDELAPDKGLPFGLTMDDLFKHLAIFGATGSGKTKSAILSIGKGIRDSEIATGKKIGLLVLDGKAQLADSFSEFVQVIKPSTVKNLNYMEGLKPEVIVSILEDIFTDGQSSGGSKFWNTSAGCAIYCTEVFLNALVSMGIAKSCLSARVKTLREMKIPLVEGTVHPLVQKLAGHPDIEVEGTVLNDSLQEFMKLQNSAPEMVSSIFATAESWLIPMLQSEELRPWADSSTSDVDFEKILYGQKFGIVLPEAKYGVAGVAITSFMTARLFEYITNRGIRTEELGQSEVVLIVDEAQRLIDRRYFAIIGVAREWKLAICIATQNIESLQEKLGDKGTSVLLGSSRNFITFKADRSTIEYVKDRVGKSIIWRTSAQAPMVDFGLNSKLALSNPVLDPKNPYGNWMKHHSFNVFRWLAGAKKTVNALSVTTGRRGGTLVASQQPEYIVTEADVQALNKPGAALCVFDRAGAPRRDVVNMVQLNTKFEPVIQEVDELAEEVI